MSTATPRIRLSEVEYEAIKRWRAGEADKLEVADAAGSGNFSDETKDGGNKREISMVSDIQTPEDALRYAKIDTAIWEIERSVVNKWDMGYTDGDGNPGAHGLWQVKVWLRRKARQGLTDALESIHKRAEEFSPNYDDYEWSEPTGDHNFVLSLYDSHFGKLCWGVETMNDYDLEIARRLFDDAADDLLKYAENLDLAKITIPFGNDFLHVDNILLTTQAGTPQGADTEGRYAKIVQVAFDALVRVIDRCALLAPVDMVLVMGNHDPTVMYHIARELRAWYRKCDRVNVDIVFRARKYQRFGKNLLGFTHGDKCPDARLVNLMPLEAKQEWAQCDFYEWHTGHLHVKKEKRPYAIDTMEGILIRRIPSLSGTDAWHYSKGYVGYRAGEAHVYHREHGPVASFIAMAREAEYKDLEK